MENARRPSRTLARRGAVLGVASDGLLQEFVHEFFENRPPTPPPRPLPRLGCGLSQQAESQSGDDLQRIREQILEEPVRASRGKLPGTGTTRMCSPDRDLLQNVP